MGSSAARYDIRRHGSDLGPVRPFKPARPRGHVSAPHSCFRTWTCSQSLRPLRNDVSRQDHAPWGWSDARPAATFPTLPEIEEACMLRIQGADRIHPSKRWPPTLPRRVQQTRCVTHAAHVYSPLASAGPEARGLVQATSGTPVSEWTCLLYTSPSPRDRTRSRMPSSA